MYPFVIAPRKGIDLAVVFERAVKNLAQGINVQHQLFGGYHVSMSTA